MEGGGHHRALAGPDVHGGALTTASDGGSTDAATGSAASLERIKEVEGDLDAKLAQVRADSEKRIKQLREVADAMLRATLAEAERARERAVAAARSVLEGEAEQIVQDGETEARRIATSADADLAPIQESILDRVLAGFRGARSK